jgi:probable HAF family extracellular repeat protein
MPRSRTSPGGLALAAAVAAALPLMTAPAARAAVVITELVGLPGYPTHRTVAVNDLGQVIGFTSGNGAPRAVLWGPRGAVGTDLGPGRPSGINQLGQVVVEEAVSGAGPYVQRPRLWHDGKVTDLAPSGSGWVIASAINNKGAVPMTYSTSPYGYHQEQAVVWRDGRHTSLPLSGPHLWLSAINDAGVVAGLRMPMFGPEMYAFRCADTTTCTPLATVPGSGMYSVEAINEAGIIVGNRDTLALRWEGAGVTVLSESGGVANGPQALNERGDVVGWSTEFTGVRRATLWRDGGKAVDLGVPGPSEAVAVNERGDVVGWTSADNPDAPRAFLWRDGRVTYLGSLGGAHSLPVALNDRGTIVGESTTADGTLKAVRWNLITMTPVR